MSEQIPDTSTVMATYATVATYRQSPNPARQAAFKAWLAATVRAAKAEAWDEGQEAGINDDLGDWEQPPAITSNPYREVSSVDQ